VLDGHHRLFCLWFNRIPKVRVYWYKNDDLDWDLYKEYIKWCKNEGIYDYSGLKGENH
jgi:hypothetical protein